MVEHKAWIAQIERQADLAACRSTTSTASTAPSIVLRAASREEAAAICDDDPFHRLGLRTYQLVPGRSTRVADRPAHFFDRASASHHRAPPAGALLVGSVPLDDTDAVLSVAATHLGTHLRRIPDGETGTRTIWVTWQQGVFAEHPDLEEEPVPEGQYAPFPRYRVRAASTRPPSASGTSGTRGSRSSPTSASRR